MFHLLNIFDKKVFKLTDTFVNSIHYLEIKVPLLKRKTLLREQKNQEFVHNQCKCF